SGKQKISRAMESRDLVNLSPSPTRRIHRQRRSAMTQFDKLALTRRDALKVGLAGAVASGAFLGVTRAAFADDTLAEIKKRGVLSTATEMQFPPFGISHK